MNSEKVNENIVQKDIEMINEEGMSDIKNPLFNIIDEVLKKSDATLASSFAN